MTDINRRAFIKSSIFAGAALGLGFYDSSLIRVNERFDTIIRNGLIYSGDGKAPYKGDIGIRDGKISAIGNLGVSAGKIVDVNGLAVSPGFIDIHTHSDGTILQAPFGDSKIFQGVTTEIAGNCGDSPFPSKKWDSVSSYYNNLSALNPGINFKSFVGQGQLRSFVVGDNDVPATVEQIEQMKSILAAAMEQGAVGISCGLEYTPGSYAPESEIAELCKVVANYNGLFAIHMRNEDDRVEEAMDEAIRIASKSGVRLQISHLKAQNAANWHKAPAMISKIESAESAGVDIAFDRYPYIAFSTGMSTFIPLTYRQGSSAEVVERLNNDSIAKEIGIYAESRIKRLGGPQNVVVTSCKRSENRIYVGKSVEECCKISGSEPWPFIRKLLAEENANVDIIGFAMREENVRLFLSHRLGMPASDGSVYSPTGPLSENMPHPRSYGTFPRFFGKYVREEKIMDLATAVMKATYLPASRLKLSKRGLLVPGYFADITVFNPYTIIDSATFEKPHQFAKGIEHVFVNGVHSIENGASTGITGGSVLIG